MKTYAVDFETFYSTKEGVSITTQGTDRYLSDPRFDAYMVSIYGPDLAYVGPPKDAP